MRENKCTTRRDLPVGTDLLDQEVGRNLREDVRNVQDGQGDPVVVVGQLEILDQAVELGIAYIRPVEEGQQIEQDHHGDDVEVNLSHQAPLLGRREAPITRTVLAVQ